MNDITDVRALIFETLAGLKSGSVNIEQAKACKGLFDSLIDTAKVEVEFCRVTDTIGSGFIPTKNPGARKTPTLIGAQPHPEATTHVVRTKDASREITEQPGLTHTINRMR